MDKPQGHETVDGGVTYLQAFCPSCQEMVLPDRSGRCVWCDTQTGARDHAPDEPPPLLPDDVCPFCGSRKARKSNRCVECRKKAGWRGKAPLDKQKAKCISDELIEEAYELYKQGHSLRAIASMIIDRTSYGSVKSAANGLHAQFRRRGWPLRDQAKMMGERNFKHGMARRGNQNAYRRWRRAQVARPCKATKKNPPGKGRSCQLNAMAGSDYCWAHAPELQEAHREQLARMRTRLNRGPSPASPVPDREAA